MQATTKGEREVNPGGGQQQQLNRTRAGLGTAWDLRSTVRIYPRIAKRLYICCVYMLELPVCSKRFHCDNCNNAIGNGREEREKGGRNRPKQAQQKQLQLLVYFCLINTGIRAAATKREGERAGESRRDRARDLFGQLQCYYSAD